MALNANALCTLAQAKGHLVVPTSDATQDARIELFINAASQRIESYCNRKFVADDYTEYHNGNGSNFIVPTQFPVNSIASIRLSIEHDWSVDPESADDYYIIDYDQTIVMANRIQRGFGNVQLIYNGGFAVIPSDLTLACLWMVEFMYKHRERGDMGRTSVGKGDESVGILASMPPMILEILNDYKRTEIPNAGGAILTQ